MPTVRDPELIVGLVTALLLLRLHRLSAGTALGTTAGAFRPGGGTDARDATLLILSRT